MFLNLKSPLLAIFLTFLQLGSVVVVPFSSFLTSIVVVAGDECFWSGVQGHYGVSRVTVTRKCCRMINIGMYFDGGKNEEVYI